MASTNHVSSEEGEKSTNNEDINEEKSFLPGYETLKDFTQAGFKAVLEVTKASQQLPGEDNWPYYNSFPSFQNAVSNQGKQVVKLMSTLIKSQDIRGNFARRDVEEKFDLLLNVNDTLLERVALNLDEVAGIRKNPLLEDTASTAAAKPFSGSWNRAPKAIATSNVQPGATSGVQIRSQILAAKTVERPQLKFDDKVDNTSRPFVPRIKDKPNAKKPLSILPELTEEGECYSHPYGYELDVYDPPSEHMVETSPRPFRQIADTPFTFVDSQEGLRDMISDIKNYVELAVDLEHHSYRSYQGFTCLMQISTRHKDYVVDTLCLRSHLHELNELFTKTSIVKVFHGADSDIEWLQRDFGLYVVNMFDTHIAGKLLGLPRLSLGFLVKHFCKVDLDKSFQLADWRIRPLSQELIEYARSDTHYLLHVYDQLRNELWQAATCSNRLMRAVFLQSAIICRKMYMKPVHTSDSHLKLYEKSKKMFNNRQMWALQELHRWRDEVARKEDESCGYVLPNHMLLQIAESLPREMQGILACCNPIPPLVRQNLGTMHRIVHHARGKSLIQMPTETEASTSAPKESWTKINIESPLHCPHQLPSRDEQRTDLPTLLNNQKKTKLDQLETPLLSQTSRIGVFSSPRLNSYSTMETNVLSPYQRYMLVKPYMQYLASQADDQGQQSTEQGQADIESMEKLKQHFMSLDSAADVKQEAPSPPPAAGHETFSPAVKVEVESGDESDKNSESEEEPVQMKRRNEDWEEDHVPRNKRPKPDKKARKQMWLDKQKETEETAKKLEGRATFTAYDALGADPNSSSQTIESFDYRSVDYGKFQGGSRGAGRQQKPSQRGNRGRGRGGGKGRQFNFPQRQNQKSFTYRK